MKSQKIKFTNQIESKLGIIVCRMNSLTFLPICLIRQFLKIGNIFYLIVAILLCIPALISQINYVFLIPVIFVIVVALVREASQEYVL